MSERPIIFSGSMVRALLAGTKTQTRRPVKGWALEWLRPDMFKPEYVALPENGACPYGFAGGLLWVRESFIHELADYCWEASVSIPCRPAAIVYRADAEDPRGGAWKSPIHMPRSLSRITLEITGVRVERLQDISEADAIAEGAITEDSAKTVAACRNVMAAPDVVGLDDKVYQDARHAYRDLWEQINSPGSWDANPWVWVVEFRKTPNAAMNGGR